MGSLATREKGAYVNLWKQTMRGSSFTLKGDSDTLPNLEEVIMGLWQLYCENMREKMKDKSAKFIDVINDSYKEAFEFMLDCVGIEDYLEPLT